MNRSSLILRILVFLAAGATIGMLLFLVGYILYQGIPYLKPSLFALEYRSDNSSMLPSIFNTLVVTAISLALAIPLGIATAIYLTEYATGGNRLVGIVRLMAETLAGIPSIIYGLFGMLLFVSTLKIGPSILAGALTLSIMILPLIMRTSEEALRAVPDGYREGSYGLGAGKLRTIGKIILPAAVPGIFAGVILGVGRVVGETAALVYTAGTIAEMPKTILSSGSTLSVHMWRLSGEGLHMNEAAATAVVLLGVVLLINTVSAVIARRVTRT